MPALSHARRRLARPASRNRGRLTIRAVAGAGRDLYSGAMASVRGARGHRPPVSADGRGPAGTPRERAQGRLALATALTLVLRRIPSLDETEHPEPTPAAP